MALPSVLGDGDGILLRFVLESEATILHFPQLSEIAFFIFYSVSWL